MFASVKDPLSSRFTCAENIDQRILRCCGYFPFCVEEHRNLGVRVLGVFSFLDRACADLSDHTVEAGGIATCRCL